jgi:hypothetical protein
LLLLLLCTSMTAGYLGSRLATIYLYSANLRLLAPLSKKASDCHCPLHAQQLSLMAGNTQPPAKSRPWSTKSTAWNGYAYQLHIIQLSRLFNCTADNVS